MFFVFIFIKLHLFRTQFSFYLDFEQHCTILYTVYTYTVHVISICFSGNKIDMHFMLRAEYFKCTEIEIAIVYALRLLPLLLS